MSGEDHLRKFFEETRQCKEIDGYPDYLISDCGRLFSIKRNRPMFGSKDKYGYLVTGLTRNGESRQFKIHRLVLSNFLHAPNEGDEANHLNGRKDDNRIENLEWCTHLENIRHAVRMGLKWSPVRRETKAVNDFRVNFVLLDPKSPPVIANKIDKKTIEDGPLIVKNIPPIVKKIPRKRVTKNDPVNREMFPLMCRYAYRRIFRERPDIKGNDALNIFISSMVTDHFYGMSIYDLSLKHNLKGRLIMELMRGKYLRRTPIKKTGSIYKDLVSSG